MRVLVIGFPLPNIQFDNHTVLNSPAWYDYGGVIAAFAKPDVVHDAVAGFPGCDRYAVLPAPAGVSYDVPFMLRADGTEVQPADWAHPFAAVLDKFRTWLRYRVRFDENLEGFPAYGRVIARSVGGAAV